MLNINDINKKKTKLDTTITEGINNLIDKTTIIFKNNKNIPVIKSLWSKFKMINEDLQQEKIHNIEYYIDMYSTIKASIYIVEIVNEKIDKYLNRTVNIDVFLSQTYVQDTINIQKEFIVSYKKLIVSYNVLLDNLLKLFLSEVENTDIFQTIEKIKEHYFVDDILMTYIDQVAHKLYQTDKKLVYRLLQNIEAYKSTILLNSLSGNEEPVNKTLIKNNPYYRSFGLLPITQLLPINEIHSLIFKKEGKGTLDSFINECRKGDYSLIVIKKIHPIIFNYNPHELLNYSGSKDFMAYNKDTDGPNENIVRRNTTISSENTNQKWQVSYDIYNPDYNYFIILEQNSITQFRVLNNFYKQNNFFINKIHITSLIEFIEYFNNSSKSIDKLYRIDIINKLNNKAVIKEMFLPIRVDLDLLKVKSQIVDPKYLRSEILITIMKLYNKLYNTTSVNTIYKYNILIHDPAFITVVSNIMMNYFFNYVSSNSAKFNDDDIISEIYLSFLPTLNIYVRDFKKKLHDQFSYNIRTFDLFDDTNKNLLASVLEKKFKDLISDILDGIITNDNNLFQIILYKLYLIKIKSLIV